MISLLLALAPATPQVPVQAQLHPQNVLIYTELPNMGELLSAYTNAPTAQMLRDPDVRTAVGELMSTVEIDLDSMLGKAAAETGMPVEMLRAPIKTLNGYLDRAEGVSLSFSLNEDRPGEFAETVTRLYAAKEELQVLHDGLYLFAVEHSDLFPDTLVELELEGVDGTDPWGRPYRYIVSSSGGFNLSSLGADGVPGGEGRFHDIDVGTDLMDMLRVELEERAGITVSVSFELEEDASQVMGLLREAAKKSPLREADGYTPARAKAVDLVWYEDGWGTTPRGEPGLWMMRSGSQLAIGAGSSDPKAMLDRMAGQGLTALTSPGYANMMSRFAKGEGATVARAFVEFHELVGVLDKLEPLENFNWKLLAPYSKSTWRQALIGDRFVTESYSLPPDPDNVMLQCVAHETIPDGLWKFIPEEAIGAGAVSMDPPRLYDLILEVVRADLAEDAVSKLNMLEAQYGFSVTGLFESLGGGGAGYMLPISGLMSLPSIALIAQLEDEEAFKQNLDGLLKLLEEQANGEFTVKYRPYRDTPLWYFSFKSGGPPIPISPSLVIIDGHVLVTLTSTRAKKEIKRVLALMDPDSEPTGVHPLRSLSPADATMAGYMDWAQLLEGGYNAAKGGLALMGGNMDLPFDINALPEAETFTDFYEPSIYWTQVRDDAIYSHSESSFGPETVLGIAGLVGSGGLAAQSMQEQRMSQMESEMIVVDPEEVAAPAAVELTESTRETMRFLATRIAVYKLEHGRYPAALESLVEPNETYPRGFLDGRELPTDSWGNGFSFTTSDGSYRLWSKGPDGLDQSGGGDDLVN